MDNIDSTAGMAEPQDSFDIDMEMDVDEETLTYDEQAALNNAQAQQADPAAQEVLGSVQSRIDNYYNTNAGDAQADPNEIRKEAIHLRGVDELSTDAITDWANGNAPLAPLKKVEWVNDSSCNLIYLDGQTAAAALAAFTVQAAQTPADPTVLRDVKDNEKDGKITKLQARIARVGDKKVPKAREQSRYYLFNPPKEELDRDRNGERRPRGGHRENSYRRRDYSRDRRYSKSRSGSRGEYRRRGRSRSRSPDAYARTYSRSRSPGRRYGRDRSRRRGADDDLFPEKAARRDDGDLFPSKVRAAAGGNDDLFPAKVSVSAHSRGRGGDLFPEKVTSGRLASDSLLQSGRGTTLADRLAPSGRSLADRLGPSTSSLADRLGPANDAGRLTRSEGDDLFPEKVVGKQGGRMIGSDGAAPSGGRRQNRRRAEDMM
ncbi:hypothetical protein SAICODRAFT_9050 [Saitoella complicata NRRL Y-17804]|nr:uncharacterized protein SAICODRAFT_9050 [Saitoella complicata NRRL Y-17804]ODQ51399.1 hypothetical protein SAICODRAFT_9050 [Saitoella complicata NRRL Y-17804]